MISLIYNLVRVDTWVSGENPSEQGTGKEILLRESRLVNYDTEVQRLTSFFCSDIVLSLILDYRVDTVCGGKWEGRERKRERGIEWEA